MSLRTFLSALRDKWSGRVAPRRRPSVSSRRRPMLEALEPRVVPATPPKIIAFSPPNNIINSVGTTTSNPTLSITFNEAMDVNDVTNTANYYLFNSEGQSIPISTVTYNAGTDTVTITQPNYNNGAILPADNYSLYIRGDTVHEATDAFTLANPGQIVVANTGTNFVSTLNSSTDAGSTLLNSVQSYPLTAPAGSAVGVAPTPVGVTVGDLDGDGFKDVAVLNSGTNEIDIYQGTASEVYGFSPTLRIALPAGAKPVDFLSKDFNGDNHPDLAVLDNTGNVDIYINTSTTGALSFAPVATYAVGKAPTSFAVADLNGDGKTDIVVADPTAVASGTSNVYNAYILPGNGNGTFGAVVAITVGTQGTVGNIQAPDLVAAGYLGLDFTGTPPPIQADSFVLGSNLAGPGGGFGNGVQSWLNQGLGTFAFTGQGIFGPNAANGRVGPTALAVGKINQNGGGFGGPAAGDVIAAFPAIAASNGPPRIFASPPVLDVFTPGGTLERSVTLLQTEVVNRIVVADVNGDGKQDILFSSRGGPLALGTKGSIAAVLLNNSTGGLGGSVTLATEADYGVDYGVVSLAYAGANGDHNPYIVTANVHTANNQTIPSFTVVRGTVSPSTNGTFIQATTVTDPNGQGPASIAVGDVNGDGIPDLVVADSKSSTVSVYPGQKNPDQTVTYGAPTTFSTLDIHGVGLGPVSVVLADLDGRKDANGNPILDIVTADSQDNTISVLMNDGLGNFATAVTYAVGSTPTQIVAADFNGDGKIDLAVSHNGGGAVVDARGVSILLGNGDGTFKPKYEILSNVQATALAAGDFFVDSTNSTDLVVADGGTGLVWLERNDGKGNFSTIGSYTAAPNIAALAAGDVNGDGFLDVVAVSNSTSTTEQITTLLNNAGSGFRPPVFTTMPLDAPVNSVAITHLNPGVPSPFPDIVVGTVGGIAQGTAVVDNVFTLTGNGDGTFQNPVPYEAGGEPSPAVVALGSDPIIHVTTFHKGGNLVAPNLIANGNFETVDLSNERGNIDGWQSISMPASQGGWYVQTGTQSPLSQTTVPALTPTGTNKFQAMLDQPNLVPLPPSVLGVTQNPNAASTYSGSNVLYQSFNVPADLYTTGGSLNLSLDLFIDPQYNGQVIPFSNPNVTNVNGGGLDYRTGSNDYQVRVDILDAADTNLFDTATGAGHVLATIFQSLPTMTPNANGEYQLHLTQDLYAALAAYAGKHVILRVVGVTNQGPLIVGVDNVSVTAKYTDTTKPTTNPSNATALQLRNLGYPITINNVVYNDTTDPTVIGRVADDGSINNVAYIAFDTDPTDVNFTGPNIFKTSYFDANGRFSLTLPNLPFGLDTLGVRIVDRAGNSTDTTFTFFYQGPSTTNWQAVGPGPINVTSVPGVQFSSVTGMVTATAADPSDLTSNTYIIGAANGGLWKTSDGGNNWTPVTDGLKDSSGKLLTLPIGAIAYDRNTPTLVYAATGDGNVLPDSQPGNGVLISTNGGATWTVSTNSETVLAGARVTAMVTANPIVNGVVQHYVYVAVASGGQFGPGVYRSTDSGQTWTDVLTPTSMGLAAGTALPSVTSLVINPTDATDITIGLGNIGLTSSAAAVTVNAGVWESHGNGLTLGWSPLVGGNKAIPNDTLPAGKNIGRVTLAETAGANGNIYYVLIGTPTSANAAPGVNVNYGGFQGLYKTSDDGKDFTKVMLNQATAPATFSPIDLLANDANNVGAMVIDPSDPNVVYIGGSVQTYNGAVNPLQHGLIRVDTGDMRDAFYTDPTTGLVPNDGDDIQKVLFAENNTLPILKEGVAWYDLAQNAVDSAGTGDRLPASITSLTVDNQGRLLIGTEDGVWRAVYHGVGYDYSSGGAGVLKLETARANVSITTINGNLQIAQLTSVAVDPLVPGRLYTTQWQTGSAVTSGGLSWNTSGLTGPTDVNGGPDGDVVVVAPPDPNAAAGTLATTYLNYAFNSKLGTFEFQPETSTQAGLNYVNLPGSADFNATDKAGYLPVLNVYDQKVTLSDGSAADVLLFGSDRIYTSTNSTTNGAKWIYAGRGATKPLSSTPGAYVVAATFAQTTDLVIYAATSDGKLWVTTNDGADGWGENDAGLPAGGKITDIVVDFFNPAKAFVTDNVGGVGHLFFTSNFGSTWRDISGNPATGGLPAANIYAVVEDPRSQPQSGAPAGRLYVGTQTGVYVSTDDTNWTRLGVGLPSAPVVSLQFNQNLEELVAGTQGRGAFMISTDRIGPHVVFTAPDDQKSDVPFNPLTGPLTSVTVTFNEAIGSFQLADVIGISGPNGPIKPLSVTDVSVAPPGQANPHNVWKITFAPQTRDGIYTFSLDQNITDLVGNKMDQNQNGINGENPGDTYTFTVDLNSTDDGRFVSGLYHDLLNRPADTTGFETVLAPIDAARYSLLPGLASAYVTGLGAPQLVQDLYQSSGTTYSTDPTKIMSILGVGNLLPGVAVNQSFWAMQLQGGASFEQIIASLVSSPEYFAQNSAGHNVNGNDAAFVTQVYEDLLNRAPFSPDLAAKVQQLANAESAARTQDARRLLGGQAYQLSVISADYHTYLNRAPSNGSAGENVIWLNNFANGATQDQLVAALLGSQEYFFSDAPAVVGAAASNDTWVRAAYKQLFPNYTINTSNPNEENYWDGLLNSGQLTTQQVAFILVTSNLYHFGDLGDGSANFVNGSVDRAYVQYLGRDANAGEITFWQQVYAANPNYRVEDLDAAILGSPEYFAAHTTAGQPLPSQDAQWADALYTSVLGSTNTPVEQSTDLPFLTAAEVNARSQVAGAILGSPEYRTDVIDFVYETDLHRLPSSIGSTSELSHWLSIVGQGASAAGGLNGDEQLLSGVLSSPEYFLLQSDPSAGGLHTNNSWLTSLYASLHQPLGAGNTLTPAQAAQESANLVALNTAYLPARQAAVNSFLSSQEYRSDFIIAEYATLLGRQPTATGTNNELSYWLSKLAAGTTQEQVIATLISSQEFFNRAPIIIGQNGQVTASDTTLVEAAYQVLFPGYTPSSGEIQGWVNQLTANPPTTTVLQMATTLDTSLLYYFGADPSHGNYVNGFVNRMYLKFLGRNATAGEINFWFTGYSATGQFDTLSFISAILSSDEYFERAHPFP